MNTLKSSDCLSAYRARRVFAVWGFCVAAITFWAGVAFYVDALSAGAAVVAATISTLAVLPVAGRLTDIVWQDDSNS